MVKFSSSARARSCLLSGTETKDAIELPTEPRQRQGPERQAEVPQGNIVEARNQQQVQDNAPQPQRDNAGPDSGLESDQNPCDDFDDADHEHEGVGSDRQELRDPGREIL